MNELVRGGTAAPCPPTAGLGLDGVRTEDPQRQGSEPQELGLETKGKEGLNGKVEVPLSKMGWR